MLIDYIKAMGDTTLLYFVFLYVRVLGNAFTFSGIIIILLCITNKVKNFKGETTRLVHPNYAMLYCVGSAISFIADVLMLDWWGMGINVLMILVFIYTYKLTRKGYQDYIESERSLR